MIEEKTVPFIEHLVELRKRLVVIVIAVVVGMGVSWNFSSDLLKFVQTRTTSALEVSRRIEAATKDYKTPIEYPGTDLAQKLKRIAQLIDAGLATRVYYVALDGFDTHSDQRDAHAGLLGQLGGALAAAY